jgi:hypothetical protein
MKQGKRKLHLDRTTVRPLNPQQLTRVAGGTGDGYIDSDLICDGSMTTNYSKNQCGTVNDPTGSP